MIDLHAHLLPGVDDGPASLEDALSLARALVEDGVTQVVATPHWTPGLYQHPRAHLLAEARKFAQALRALKIPLQLSLGCELRVDAGLPDLVDADEVAYLGTDHAGYRYILLEMPDSHVPPGIERLLRLLLDRKVRALIAHPERNKGVMEQPERLRPLMELGCKVQVTAGSVLGEFGSTVLRTTQTLIDQGWVDVVANDAHNLRGRRPRMAAARQALLEQVGERRVELWMQRNPAKFTAGNPLL